MSQSSFSGWFWEMLFFLHQFWPGYLDVMCRSFCKHCNATSCDVMIEDNFLSSVNWFHLKWFAKDSSKIKKIFQIMLFQLDVSSRLSMMWSASCYIKTRGSNQFPPNPFTPATASPDDFPDLLKGLPAAIPFIGFIHGVFSREGCVETDPSKHHLATQRVSKTWKFNRLSPRK